MHSECVTCFRASASGTRSNFARNLERARATKPARLSHESIG
jgi:hypothetical protein